MKIKELMNDLVQAVTILKLAELNTSGNAREINRRAKIHIFRQILPGSKAWEYCIKEKLCS
jgi:hypothetical protein